MTKSAVTAPTETAPLHLGNTSTGWRGQFAGGELTTSMLGSDSVVLLELRIGADARPVRELNPGPDVLARSARLV